MTGCKVDGCDKAAQRRGYCFMHYRRVQVHGDPSVVLKPHGRSVKIRLTCSVEDCGNPAKALGLCGKHYQRRLKYGDPLTVKQARDRTPVQRFWSFVDKDGPVPERKPELGQCWIWTGGLSEGYGAFHDGTKQVKAHIFSYTLARGLIEEGQERDHLCRNRACVRPDHLEAVTHWTNVARGTSPHGKNSVKTHCKNGHEYTPENTRIRKDGSRVCITCARAACLRHYYRKRDRKAQQRAAS